MTTFKIPMYSWTNFPREYRPRTETDAEDRFLSGGVLENKNVPNRFQCTSQF